MGFPRDGHLEVVGGTPDLLEGSQVGMSVNCFGSGSGSKKFGGLRVSFSFGFFGKRKIFTVGLGFAGKGIS
jgi:hypothetical protein